MAFDDIFDTIKDGVTVLAKNTVKDFLSDAQADADHFLNESKEDLRRWSDMLALGQLKPAEFKFLVKMQGDLAEMHALTSVGIAKTRVERFRTGLISLIVKSVLGAL